jgi:hypothetical protein
VNESIPPNCPVQKVVRDFFFDFVYIAISATGERELEGPFSL